MKISVVSSPTSCPDRTNIVVELLSKKNPFSGATDLPDPPRRPEEQRIPRHLPSIDQVSFIQKEILTLTYNHLSNTFFSLEKQRPLDSILQTGKDVLEEALPIRCLEATFLGVYLTQPLHDLYRFPLSFSSWVGGKYYSHIVLVLYHRGDKSSTAAAECPTARFGALGLSRKETLMYKPMTYPSLFSLIMDYKHHYEALGHRLADIRLGLAFSHAASALSRSPCWRFVALRLSSFLSSPSAKAKKGSTKRKKGKSYSPQRGKSAGRRGSKSQGGKEKRTRTEGSTKDDEDDEEEEEAASPPPAVFRKSSKTRQAARSARGIKKGKKVATVTKGTTCATRGTWSKPEGGATEPVQERDREGEDTTPEKDEVKPEIKTPHPPPYPYEGGIDKERPFSSSSAMLLSHETSGGALSPSRTSGMRRSLGRVSEDSQAMGTNTSLTREVSLHLPTGKGSRTLSSTSSTPSSLHPAESEMTHGTSQGKSRERAMEGESFTLLVPHPLEPTTAATTTTTSHSTSRSASGEGLFISGGSMSIPKLPTTSLKKSNEVLSTPSLQSPLLLDSNRDANSCGGNTPPDTGSGLPFSLFQTTLSGGTLHTVERPLPHLVPHAPGKDRDGHDLPHPTSHQGQERKRITRSHRSTSPAPPPPLSRVEDRHRSPLSHATPSRSLRTTSPGVLLSPFPLSSPLSSSSSGGTVAPNTIATSAPPVRSPLPPSSWKEGGGGTGKTPEEGGATSTWETEYGSKEAPTRSPSISSSTSSAVLYQQPTAVGGIGGPSTPPLATTLHHLHPSTATRHHSRSPSEPHANFPLLHSFSTRPPLLSAVERGYHTSPPPFSGVTQSTSTATITDPLSCSSSSFSNARTAVPCDREGKDHNSLSVSFSSSTVGGTFHTPSGLLSTPFPAGSSPFFSFLTSSSGSPPPPLARTTRTAGSAVGAQRESPCTETKTSRPSSNSPAPRLPLRSPTQSLPHSPAHSGTTEKEKEKEEEEKAEGEEQAGLAKLQQFLAAYTHLLPEMSRQYDEVSLTECCMSRRIRVCFSDLDAMDAVVMKEENKRRLQLIECFRSPLRKDAIEKSSSVRLHFSGHSKATLPVSPRPASQSTSTVSPTGRSFSFSCRPATCGGGGSGDGSGITWKRDTKGVPTPRPATEENPRSRCRSGSGSRSDVKGADTAGSPVDVSSSPPWTRKKSEDTPQPSHPASPLSSTARKTSTGGGGRPTTPSTPLTVVRPSTSTLTTMPRPDSSLPNSGRTRTRSFPGTPREDKGSIQASGSRCGSTSYPAPYPPRAASSASSSLISSTPNTRRPSMVSGGGAVTRSRPVSRTAGTAVGARRPSSTMPRGKRGEEKPASTPTTRVVGGGTRALAARPPIKATTTSTTTTTSRPLLTVSGGPHGKKQREGEGKPEKRKAARKEVEKEKEGGAKIANASSTEVSTDQKLPLEQPASPASSIMGSSTPLEEKQQEKVPFVYVTPPAVTPHTGDGGPPPLGRVLSSSSSSSQHLTEGASLRDASAVPITGSSSSSSQVPLRATSRTSPPQPLENVLPCSPRPTSNTDPYSPLEGGTTEAFSHAKGNKTPEGETSCRRKVSLVSLGSSATHPTKTTNPVVCISFAAAASASRLVAATEKRV